MPTPRKPVPYVAPDGCWYACHRCSKAITDSVVMVKVRPHTQNGWTVFRCAPGLDQQKFMVGAHQPYHAKCVPPNQFRQAWRVMPAQTDPSDLDASSAQADTRWGLPFDVTVHVTEA